MTHINPKSAAFGHYKYTTIFLSLSRPSNRSFTQESKSISILQTYTYFSILHFLRFSIGTGQEKKKHTNYKAARFVTGQALQGQVRSDQGAKKNASSEMYLLSLGSPLVTVLLDEGIELLGSTRSVRVADRTRTGAVQPVYPVEDRSKDL